ncbi:hypothetical protein LCGC14_0577180 [marine sediment metagenome]|uniref:Uncharacterized protein n=1 Tax=marine sediment metagenome TaxID=412755 RepID=A0A0F9U3T3_9ZZZZ
MKYEIDLSKARLEDVKVLLEFQKRGILISKRKYIKKNKYVMTAKHKKAIQRGIKNRK